MVPRMPSARSRSTMSAGRPARALASKACAIARSRPTALGSGSITSASSIASASSSKQNPTTAPGGRSWTNRSSDGRSPRRPPKTTAPRGGSMVRPPSGVVTRPSSAVSERSRRSTTPRAASTRSRASSIAESIGVGRSRQELTT
jgi:hypothetical protein